LIFLPAILKFYIHPVLFIVLFWKRGGVTAANLHLKVHTRKQLVFAHTQIGANWTFYNKLGYLWGILS